MKKTLLFLSIVAVAVASCNKEDVSELQSEQINDTFVFTSAKPVVEDVSGTKTEWTGHTIQWSKDDQMRMAYTVNGVWQGANGSDNKPKLYASNRLAEATDVAKFTINTSFAGSTTGTHIFYGLYPGTLVGGTDIPNAPVVSITIPSEQTPKANSFDSKADVMVGVSEEKSSKPSSSEDILMKWTRKVAHADLTLTNLSINSGESIQNITLTAQDDADLVGVHSINLVTGEISNPQGTTNSIFIKADNLTYSGNKIEFWASMLPAVLTKLTVTVETDKAYYTKSFSGFSREFKRNKWNTMSIGMTSATRIAKDLSLEDYEESLINTLGDFTLEGESYSSSLPYVWSATSYGATGSAYYNGTRYAATSYLVSPSLKIGSSNSKLTFEHAANRVNGNFSTYFSVWVFDLTSGTETQISLSVKPSGNDWNFVTSTVDLGGYEGKTIQIAFKYTSTGSVAGTWEIKNFKVTDVNPNQSGFTATGWLELPAKQTGNEYYNGVFKVTVNNKERRNYSYMYEYSTYTCLWVAYPLYSGAMTTSNNTILGPYTPMEMASMEDRGQTWAKNPDIAEGKQVNCWSASYNVLYGQTNYVNDASGTGQEYYARGHQIPNADRSEIDQMQTQTYYATNSTPQIQNSFNAKVWGQLEAGVRSSVKDTVYVVTGAAFAKVGETKSITYIHPKGDPYKSVPVPNYYWKVLLKVKRNGSNLVAASAIGFWFVHEPYDTNDYTQYRYSVDQIEEWTGFDFFTNLPVSLQETAESNTNWNTFKSF
ncbi:MAG: DNA/RNA non-specific endonuclease [Bacteroidales bacterium]|nr:DNA/RNA non-specific endonuclease [Bacteroidales bacterium]